MGYAAGRPQLNEVGRMKILVAGWDSGGGVEAVQTVVGRAVARGHQVRVLGTEGLRSRFESAGGGIANLGGTVTLKGTRVAGNIPDNCEPPGTIPGCTG